MNSDDLEDFSNNSESSGSLEDSSQIPEFQEQLRRAQTDESTEAPDEDNDEILLIGFYPENKPPESPAALNTAEVEKLVEEALERTKRTSSATTVKGSIGDPVGYVSNARNALSSSEAFKFWSSAENNEIGVGSLVRHCGDDPKTGQTYETFGIITDAQAQTLGLDDFADSVYEHDALPPHSSIITGKSQRRGIFSYEASVLSSNSPQPRPTLPGPVYPVLSSALPAVHGQPQATNWPGLTNMILGFYQDGAGEWGVFCEELTSVLGPKKGHVILSGSPGAGKTSLFLTDVISLYAGLRKMEEEGTKEEEDAQQDK